MQRKYQSNNSYTQIIILGFSTTSMITVWPVIGLCRVPFISSLLFNFSKTYYNVSFLPKRTSLKLSAPYSFPTQHFYDLFGGLHASKTCFPHFSLSHLIILIAIRAGLCKNFQKSKNHLRILDTRKFM